MNASQDMYDVMSDGTNEGDTPDTMMSIFASYYGIQDDNSKNKLLIDSPQFDPEEYLQDLLSSQTIENFAAKDVTLVHEIRALDSDMQMLVYENYNKFISATETIKRMKANVEGMDDDLSSVRTKMERITQISTNLDNSLSEKRGKVEKLVRIRRLLMKLEFLSELPERLVELINQGQYKRAVQIYRRTISVLTKHSHLLSFKNIKERTENMMHELRDKVTLLLDDPALEVDKLTHYAAILRLMEAPRGRVLDRLMQAHRSRLMQVIGEFNPPSSTGSKCKNFTGTVAGTDATTGAVSGEVYLASVSSARKFHQSVIASLIEACRGWQELYGPLQASAGTSQSPISTDSNQNLFADSKSNNQNRVQSRDPQDVENDETPESRQECLLATKKLRNTIEEIFPLYRTRLLDALVAFFASQGRHYELCRQLELLEQSGSTATSNNYSDSSSNSLANPNENVSVHDDIDDQNSSLSQAELHRQIITKEKKSQASAWRAAQLHQFDLEEERNAWMLLARQTVLDWDYLDQTLKDCSPSRLDIHEYKSAETVKYSAVYSAGLLEVLEYACRLQFDLVTMQLMHEVSLSAVKFSELSDVASEVTRVRGSGGYVAAGRGKDSLGGGTGSQYVSSVGTHGVAGGRSSHGTGSGHGTSSHGSGHGYLTALTPAQQFESVALRGLIQARASDAKVVMDSLVDSFASSFAKICSNAKPVLEIFDVALNQLQSESSRNIQNGDHEYVLGYDLLWRFVIRMCSLLELYCGSRHSLHYSVTTTASATEGGIQADFQHGYVYEEWVHASEPWMVFGASTGSSPQGKLFSFSPKALPLLKALNQNTSPIDNSQAVEARYPTLSMEKFFKQMWEGVLANELPVDQHRPIYAAQGLAVYGFLHRTSLSVVARLEGELRVADLALGTKAEVKMKDRCVSRLESASKVSLLQFVESNITAHSTSLTTSYSSALSKPTLDAATVCVSPAVTAVAGSADSIAVACCVLLFEPIPQFAGKVLNDRDPSKRLVTAPGSQSGAGSGSHINLKGRPGAMVGVQRDIERLFSQKIQIFEPSVICTGTINGIVGSVLKAFLKSATEQSRMTCLDNFTYRSRLADFAFLRQIGGSLLKENALSEVDQLSEQGSIALFTRYVNSGEFSASMDTVESSQVSKAVAEALITEAMKSLVLVK